MLKKSFPILFFPFYTFLIKPASYFIPYNYNYPFAPYYERWVWRVLVFFPNVVISTKLASLLILGGALVLIWLLSDTEVEIFLWMGIILLGSFDYFYLSDVVVIICLQLIKKYPSSPFLLLIFAVKEDLVLYYIFFASFRYRWVAVPLTILNRVLFAKPYMYASTHFIQLGITILSQRAFLGYAFIGIVFLVLYTHHYQLDWSDRRLQIYILFFIPMICLLTNPFEFNKYLALIQECKQKQDQTLCHSEN